MYALRLTTFMMDSSLSLCTMACKIQMFSPQCPTLYMLYSGLEGSRQSIHITSYMSKGGQGEERVRGWEGSEGGGRLNIQSPDTLYKPPTDNTKPQQDTKTPTDNTQPQHTIHKPDGEERGGGEG